MEAAVVREEIWDGGALNNPANVTIRPWKTAAVDVQSLTIVNALRHGRALLKPCLLHIPGIKKPVKVQHLECLAHTGMGDETIHRFHAWAPLAPEAEYSPTEHWRLLYELESHASGVLHIVAIFVAPDRAVHHSRPRPSLP